VEQGVFILLSGQTISRRFFSDRQVLWSTFPLRPSRPFLFFAEENRKKRTSKSGQAVIGSQESDQ
jgi:hypothetical protein